MAVIVIDPGHGGAVPVGGSSPNNATGPAGTPEKQLTLAIGIRLRDHLVAAGHRALMTRENDVNLGLVERAHLARDNQAPVFISIHLNADADLSINGSETWLHTRHSARSEALAEAVQPSLVRATGRRDRGVKSKNLGVLNPDFHDPGTACCLVEVSFLTDPEEERRLLSAEYQDRVAAALARGIQDHLDLPIAMAPAAVATAVFEEDGAFASTAAAEEASLWAQQHKLAEAALAFHSGFLGLVSGAEGNAPLDADRQTQLKLIQRAVSWVESKHGTAGSAGNQPARDPMQCGNPADSWWRELTGQTTKQSRFVRGPGLTNLNASELPNAADLAGLTPIAALSRLSDRNTGHDDQNFVADTSYYWSIPLLIHRINTGAGFPAYRCGDLSSSALVSGAAAYNGGGDPEYKTKIVAALALIGGEPSELILAAAAAPPPPHVKDLPALFEDLLRRTLGIAARAERAANRISIAADLTEEGSLSHVDIEVGMP